MTRTRLSSTCFRDGEESIPTSSCDSSLLSELVGLSPTTLRSLIGTEVISSTTAIDLATALRAIGTAIDNEVLESMTLGQLLGRDRDDAGPSPRAAAGTTATLASGVRWMGPEALVGNTIGDEEALRLVIPFSEYLEGYFPECQIVRLYSGDKGVSWTRHIQPVLYFWLPDGMYGRS